MCWIREFVGWIVGRWFSVLLNVVGDVVDCVNVGDEWCLLCGNYLLLVGRVECIDVFLWCAGVDLVGSGVGVGRCFFLFMFWCVWNMLLLIVIVVD